MIAFVRQLEKTISSVGDNLKKIPDKKQFLFSPNGSKFRIPSTPGGK
jgi:hypothetical protein